MAEPHSSVPPRWFGLTARIARLGPACSDLHHGDACRVLGGSDIVLVITIGAKWVHVRDADAVDAVYPADELRIVA